MAQGRRPPIADVETEDAEAASDICTMPCGTPERQLLADEIAATVQRCLAALPEDLRTAVTLREIDGLSYEEIAEVMDCPIGTVRSRIFRAREAIDVELKPPAGVVIDEVTMNDKLSAFVDNELDELETRRLLATLAGTKRCAAWGRYHLAGAVLRRREPLAPVDVAARVAAALLRTHVRPRPAWQAAGAPSGQLALAASVAAIAIVWRAVVAQAGQRTAATVAQRLCAAGRISAARGSRWDTNQREGNTLLTPTWWSTTNLRYYRASGMRAYVLPSSVTTPWMEKVRLQGRRVGRRQEPTAGPASGDQRWQRK